MQINNVKNKSTKINDKNDNKTASFNNLKIYIQIRLFFTKRYIK